MAIRTYTKGEKIQLSKNLVSTEFDCHGKGCCSSTKIDSKLVDYIQKIRNHFGKSITINSGYRCPKHNASIGGASKSNHMDGEAADIQKFNGIDPIEIARYAESIGVLGIGVYSWGVHIDTRTSKYFWYDGGESNVKTFQETEEKETPPETTIESTFKPVSIGSQGDTVKQIQEILYSLGYSLTTNPNKTGIDGIFGSMTQKAIIDFQRKNNLDDDGIVGEITMSALKSVKINGFMVKITANVLNVRSGPGTTNSIVATVRKNNTYKIVESKDGWGKINNPSGWISLKYTTKI